MAISIIKYKNDHNQKKAKCAFCLCENNIQHNIQSDSRYSDGNGRSTIFPICNYCFGKLIDEVVDYLERDSSKNAQKRYHRLADDYAEYIRYHSGEEEEE